MPILEDYFPTGTSIGVDTDSGNIGLYYPTYGGVTDSVILDANWLPFAPQATRFQQRLMSASGKLSVYDTGLGKRVLTINIGNLTETKKNRLFKFLVNICKGALNTFQVIDESGVTRTARWMNDTFNMPMEVWNKCVAQITLWVEDTELN